MQQLHDFNTVCYEKVIQQVRNGHQVGCITTPVSVDTSPNIFDSFIAECILYSSDCISG